MGVTKRKYQFKCPVCGAHIARRQPLACRKCGFEGRL